MAMGFITFFSSRVERKLALLLSLVALLSLLVLGVLAVNTITTTRQRNIAELEWQLVNQSSARLRKFIDDKLSTFRIVIADPQVLAVGPEQQKFLVQAQLDTDPSLLEVDFLSPDEFGQWVAIRAVRGVANPVRPTVGLDDPVLAAALQKQNYLSPVYLVDGQPYLTLGTPVVNQQGSVIGALRGEVDLEQLGPLVAQANLGSSGYLYLVDRNSKLLAWSTNFSGSSDKRSVRASFQAPSYVSDVLSGVASAVSITAETYISPHDREQVFAVGRTIPKLSWAVMVEWPETEAMEIGRVVVGRLVWAALALLLVLIGLSVVVARSFTKPLRELKAATEEIGQGKFDVELKMKSQDEVGELSKSFQEMTKGLKELERLKDEFVFIAAHELRTPVTAIRGYAEMLGDVSQSLPEQGKEFVTRLQQSGARLATLVNDLLEVARSQAGRLKVETTPQDLVGIIQTTLAELTPLAKEKNHAVTFTPPANLPQVMADQAKLQEVLVNLVGNAIKYTPAGGGVEVSVEQQGSEVATHIKDNGIGIGPEDQAKLFQRFFRVESEETKSIQGTGLGLFIVRQIVEHMNGKIWVESTKGQGSTFSFSLPVALATNTSVTASTPASQAKG